VLFKALGAEKFGPDGQIQCSRQIDMQYHSGQNARPNFYSPRVWRERTTAAKVPKVMPSSPNH
jgi:hypothetical protein